MIISDIKLLNFRIHENFKQTFSNGVNLIIGENSAGKTSILEAIYMLANTKSFRAHNDKILIKDKSDGFYIKGSFVLNSFTHTAEISYNSNIKLIKYDNERIKKIRDYIAKISVVLYNPNNLYIVNEGPVYRREFINIILSKTDIEYYIALRSYFKLLAEKRAALKMYNSRKIKFDVLELINRRLSEFAVIIVFKRLNFVKCFSLNVAEKFNTVMLRNSRLKLEYKTNCLNVNNYRDAVDLEQLKKELQDKFLKQLGAEIRNYRIMIGPQSDEIFISDDAIAVKDYYSQGERKSLTLALKLAEIYYTREMTGGFPVVLLDDIFSELDERRRKYLINELNKGFQTIITDTDFNEHLLKFDAFKKIELMRGLD